MLFLVVVLLCWTQTEGDGRGTNVRIFGGDRVVPVGGGFNLSCEFTSLRPQHVAQMWKNNGHGDKVSLVNITSALPNMMVVLSISSATLADTGYYNCMTQPPNAISPDMLIQIAASPDNRTTTSTPTTPSTPQLDSTQQHSSAPGLPGQIWYWMLLGKIAVLLFTLVTLAVKYKKG